MHQSQTYDYPLTIILGRKQGASISNVLYVENEPEFIRKTVLSYPHIDPRSRFNLVVSKDYPKARALACSMAKTFPNASHFDELPHHRLLIAEVDILGQSIEKMSKYGITSLFTDGFSFENGPDFQISLESDLGISPARMAELSQHVNDWSMNVHDYTSSELIAILFFIFKNLKDHPDVKKQFEVSDSQLLWFLCVCRLFYRTNVAYHSFFHCADVTQFAYLSLTQPNAWSLDGLTTFGTILAAAGHDVLHPGISGPLLTKIDSTMSQKYPSLEAFHADVFHTLLTQLLPQTCDCWRTITEAISATNLEHHKALVSSTPTFVHILKMSDFACCVRPGFRPHEITSVAIFLEFSNQKEICRLMKIDPDIVLPIPEPPKSDLQKIVDIQIRFISSMVIPYFEYLAKYYSPYQVHVKSAKLKLHRFECLRDGNSTFSALLPSGIPRSCFAVSKGSL